ncbi:hypothetical protein [Aliikangiella sp. IMCC44359]
MLLEIWLGGIEVIELCGGFVLENRGTIIESIKGGLHGILGVGK